MIKVKVEHYNAWCEAEELLTSGTVGLEVQVEFSPDWKDLIPHVVFSNGETELAAVLKGGRVTVPWEIMAKPKHNLRMGVRGLNEDGSIVIPTVYADLGQIQLGTKDTTDEGREATPSLVGQITNIAQNAEDIAQSVRDDADAGKFAGAPGKSPYVGENGNWFVWDNALKEFVDTGVHAQGGQGLEGKPLQAFAVCYDEAAPVSTGANTWYVPKTMPKPTGEVGLMVDVFWVNGKSNDLGYDIQLIWGEPGGADNEVIVDTASSTDKLTGSHSIPTEGTVRYVLTEANGRKRWEYVSGELIPTQFSTNTAADVANKVVPGLSIEYLPGMEIYVQLDQGNTVELISLVDDNGVSLPVYGNGTGATTGTIPTGYILHLKNAGDHWQIINSGGSTGGGGGDVSKAYVDIQDKATLDSAKAYADGKLVTIDIETRGENSFWTLPLTTAKEIIDMVNAGKEVRLHFYDTITNTGDQLYPYETTIDGVPIFRRPVINTDTVSRINIKVQYNGEVKFEEVNYTPSMPPEYKLPTMSAVTKGGATVGTGLEMTGEALGIKDKAITNAKLGDAAVDHRVLGKGSVYGDKLKPPTENALGGVLAKVETPTVPSLPIVTNALGNLLAKGGDEIEAQGTSGIWTYIKYKSGLAVCWGLNTFSYTAEWAPWGSSFVHYLPASQIPYPFPFAEVPKEYNNLLGLDSGVWCSQAYINTKTTSNYLTAVRGTQGGSTNRYMVTYLVIGRWK